MSKRDLQLLKVAHARKDTQPDTPEARRLDAIEAAVKASESGADADTLKAAVRAAEEAERGD